jgi:hypothetical protein
LLTVLTIKFLIFRNEQMGKEDFGVIAGDCAGHFLFV